MKKLLFTTLSLMLLTGCGSANNQPSTPQNNQPSSGQNSTTSTTTIEQSISIANFAFTPNEITISAGQTVTWVNDDQAAHTVKGADFESSTLNTGDSYSHKFDNAGTYAYICGIHPSMKGTVIVK